MKIVLVKPPRFENSGTIGQPPTPPLGLAYIAGALEVDGHDLTVIDAVALAPRKYIPFKPFGEFIEGHETLVTRGISFEEAIARIPSDTQLLGVHCMFSMNWIADRYFLHLIRKKMPGIVIVAGGEHVSGSPDICLLSSDLDVIVTGEGEETIVELVKAVEKNTALDEISGIVFKKDGKIVTTSPRKRKRNLEEIPRPAWHLFSVDTYNENSLSWSATSHKSIPILATRGCPYTCTFCSSPSMWGTRYFMRSPEDVLDEMQQLKSRYKIENFDFYDLTAIISRDWIIRFCKLLVESNMNITWQLPAGTRTEVIDKEVARWLYHSGCKNLVYAPESGSHKMLEEIHKKVNISKMLKSIRDAKSENLNVTLNMILGLPNERHIDIFKTLWFYIKASGIGVDSIAQSNFHPYSGSELFNQLTKDGKINPNLDEHYLEMVYIDTNSRTPIYNDYVSRNWYHLYVYLTYATFYVSNFVFRPHRIIKLIKNVVNSTYESRFEKHLGEYFRKVI
ncbi:MAG: B12-binding domain-containing radical SAM protein [Chitinophagales bacterium]|nr:B12-binding domain-containing radical SAM protein [Chitinophagales bacterium]